MNQTESLKMFIFIEPSKCLKFMTFREGFFLSYMLNTYKYLSEALEALSPSVLQKMEKDNIGESDDYDAPFCEQQYIHGSCCISLFKFRSFDQIYSPELPQILDIYSVLAL